MEFVLKNVGLIKDSTIKLNGLTVITGSNNSGKSTIGKALYATIEGFCDLEIKRENELKLYFSKTYFEACRILDLENIIKYIDLSHFDKDIVETMHQIADFGLIRKDKFDVFEEIERFIRVLEILDPEKLDVYKLKSEMPKRFYAYLGNLNESRDKAYKIILKIKDFIQEKTLDDYAKDSVLNLLKSEFKGQIYPVNQTKTDKKSKISLFKNGEIGCDFTIKEDKLIINQGKILNKMFVNNVFLIDDPYLVDNMMQSQQPLYFPSYRKENRSNHKNKLLYALSSASTDSLVEKSINEKQYFDIMQKINLILPGHISQKDGAFYYTEDNKKPIRIENLATGSKLFIIISELIRKGYLNLDTMLILDEPESHLHPEWQNIMAEIVVLLVKELNVNVLLTTHSTNFVLAIETYMRKYGIKDFTNFYMTEYLDDGSTKYNDLNGKIDAIYSDFIRSFSLMKAERAKFVDED